MGGGWAGGCEEGCAGQVAARREMEAVGQAAVRREVVVAGPAG